MNQRISPREI